MHLKTFSMDPSPEGLKKYLEKSYPDGIYHLVYEVGFSGFWIYRRFKQLSVDCLVINPADVPTAHKEKERKSDPVDSNKLARELEKGTLEGIYVPTEDEQHLRTLCRLYTTSVQSTTRVKNRIKGLLHFNGIEYPIHSSCWPAKFISYLQSLPLDNGPARKALSIHMDELRLHRMHTLFILKELKKHLRTSHGGTIIRLLISVPGVGFKSAVIFYTEIMDMKRFSNFNKLRTYIGLVPSTHDSGETQSSSGLTVRKNKFLRHIIIESAWVAIRKDPALLAYYNKQRSRMKSQRAIIRVAVKLLSRIRYVWLNEHAYVSGIVEGDTVS
jgi:transposase